MPFFQVYKDEQYDFVFYFQFDDVLLAVIDYSVMPEIFHIYDFLETNVAKHIWNHAFEDRYFDTQYLGIYLFYMPDSMSKLMENVYSMWRVIEENKDSYHEQLFYFIDCITCGQWVGVGKYMNGCKMVKYGAEDKCDICA